MRWIRWGITGFMLAVLGIGPTQAATYLVWTNGSQTAPYDTWTTAFSNLEDAVATAAAGSDTLWITNGLYGVTNPLTVTNGVILRGVDRDAVIVRRADTNYHRVFYVSNGTLDTLTIENGYGGVGMNNYHGLGVYLTTGQVLNCLIRNNTGVAQPENGSGIYMLAGLVANCVITNNSGVGDASTGTGLYMAGGVASNCLIAFNVSGSGNGKGGGLGMTGGLADRCTIQGNSTPSANGGGGGVYMSGGTLQNSLIRNNRTGTWFGSLGFPYSVSGNGGGVYMAGAGAVMRNCTVVGNQLYSIYTGSGLWMTTGTVVNSIIYFNGRPDYPWDDENVYKTGGSIIYSCTTPAVAGAGNTTGEPDFVDMAGGDFRLRTGSACIDAGSNIAAVVTDLDGNPRPTDGNADSSSLWDIGAYEAADATTGVLRCNAIATTNEALNSLTAVFTAAVAGTNRTINFYGWDFNGDGTNEWSGPSLSTVTNTYTTGFYTVRLTVTNAASESADATKVSYIRVGSPVTYVSTNGGNIFPYDTWEKASTNVLVAVEAAYAKTGGQGVVVGDGVFGLTNVILLNRPITVRSLNGPTRTVLARKSTSAFRVATLLRAGSKIEGCAISNGYNSVTTSRGGGVLMFPNTTLQNCIVVSNGSVSAAGYGGGVHLFGGGTLRNCLITRNRAALAGGGVYGGLFAVYSLGIGAGGRIENCTIVSNIVTGAGGYGGGIAGGSTTNSIILYNGASSNENWYTGSVIGYSCSTPAPPGTNNVDVAPMFKDATADNYRLMTLSPCRDCGIFLPWMIDATDLAGNKRVFNAGPDLGAYEVPLQGTMLMVR